MVTLDGMRKNQLSVLYLNDYSACSQAIMTHLLLLGIRKTVNTGTVSLFSNKYGLFHGFIFLAIKKF